MAESGIGTAMKYFGKLPGQSLTAFRDEWGKLSDEDKKQLVDGIRDETYNY